MKYLKQFGVILFVSFLGEACRLVLPFSAPASIYGLILMLAALVTGVIPYETVKETGDFLVEIMPVMFIPAAVGILDSWADVEKIWLPVLAVIFLTTVLVMAVSGKITQLVIKRGRGHE